MTIYKCDECDREMSANGFDDNAIRDVTIEWDTPNGKALWKFQLCKTCAAGVVFNSDERKKEAARKSWVGVR